MSRHPDFMEIALNAADVKRIAQAGNIAVVLGVEIDNTGNFNMLNVANMPPAVAQPLRPRTRRSRGRRLRLSARLRRYGHSGPRGI